MNKQEIIDKLNKWAKSRNIDFTEYDPDDYDYNTYTIYENVLELTHDTFYWDSNLDFFLIKELYDLFSPKNIKININSRDEPFLEIIFESDII